MSDGKSKLPSEFYSQFKIFHELMQSKVREILLVSSSYDAYIVEEDGTWNMLGEIFLMRIPAFARHVPRRVDQDEVRRVELTCKFIGLRQPSLGLQQVENLPFSI